MGAPDEPKVAERVGHTPGPWTVCFSRYNGYVAGFHIAASPHGSTAPIVETPGSHYSSSPFSPAEIEQQGNLIAAAPDMLAALKEVQAYVLPNPQTGSGSRSLHGVIRAAIAKAEGR